MGCAGGYSITRAPGFPHESWSLQPDELDLIEREGADFDLVINGVRGDEVLRRSARPVPAGFDTTAIAKRMEETMRRAGGVGLAGPQVGLSLRVAVLMLDYRSKNPRILFVRNPSIVERSDETRVGFEGCLSIPNVGGRVRRHKWIRVQHTTREGELCTVESEGINAVLWQHELDHLDGVLYIDRLLGELLPMEEVRQLRKASEQGRTIKSLLAADEHAVREPTYGPFWC